jgi:Beta-galactosidase/beta-glucuronidase
MIDDLPQLDVFYGDLTVNRAFVYARLPVPTEPGTWSLVGLVRGPRCFLAETLPVTSPLLDLGPGPTLLARATIPDPCFWSPDLPAIYDVTVNLLRGTQLVATARREVGLRALGVRGRHLALESKRWVLRGVSSESTTATLPRQWHEAVAALVAKDAAPEALAEASQWGAICAAEVRGTTGQIANSLRQLSQYPGVAIALVRGNLPADFQRSQFAPNLLLAQVIGRGNELVRRPWADLLWVQSDDLLLIGRAAALAELPVVVCRRLARRLPIEAARAACDALQRDLVSVGQFAGYVA